MKYYSPTTNCFYLYEYKEKYIASNNWPDDVIQTSEKDWEQYGKQTAPLNKVRGFIDNTICWVDSLPPNNDELAQSERLWRNKELFRADTELNKVQDSDTKAYGAVSDWRMYRRALRAWPENPDFPTKEKRPTPPDFKE